MARSRFKKGEEHSIAEGGELNLVPYLDIMVNLIMFMLLTFEVVAELKIINFNPPASGPGLDISQSPTGEKTVMLTVMITSEGFQILTDSDDMGTEKVPKKNGDWDYAELSFRLDRVKKAVANIDENLIVVAESAVIYNTVVQTLDAARATPDGNDLFPRVTLGMAVGTQ